MNKNCSVETAHAGSTTYVFLVCIVAASGGLLVGYDIDVINEAIGPLKKHFDLDPVQQGWAFFSALLGCTALTLTFPYLKGGLGAHGAFWLYGVICVIGFVVIFLKLPETKGKSLEDIERELVD